MQLDNRTSDVWTLILIKIPYLSLSVIARSSKLISRIIKDPWFWYSKTIYELKKDNARQQVEFSAFKAAVNPRLLYVRLLGLNYIQQPGFEIYFSPLEMMKIAILNKDQDLIDYLVKYVLSRKEPKKKISRLDWLASNLAKAGYLEESYTLITQLNLKVSNLSPFFYIPSKDGNIGLKEEEIEVLLRIQEAYVSPKAVRQMRSVGLICKSIAEGNYKVEEVLEFNPGLYEYVAVKFNRTDLVGEILSVDTLDNLLLRHDYAKLEAKIAEGKIDLSKERDIADYLENLDSYQSFWHLFLNCFTGQFINGRHIESLFKYKPAHDLNGFRLMLNKLPKEMISAFKLFLPPDCRLAKILVEERLRS